jgi:CBS domain-containing protein
MSAPAQGSPPADWRRALTMYSPVEAVLRHAPVTVALDATVRQVLEAMDRQRADAVVVADPTTRVPLGTFSTRDAVRRVALEGGDLDQPVALVMTSGLITLGPGTTAHQAALSMARLGVGHLVVVDGEGRLLGLVSRDELFGLQRAGLDQVSEAIQAASDVPALQAAAAGIRRLADGLLAQGTSAENVIHFITTLNDLLTIRVIELVADQRDLPGVPWCWMAAGSEGRLEQTFATDQDNALILDAEESDGEALRRDFLPFARQVNDTLAACGFPLCPGNYMAGNPRWCLTLGEWRRTFEGWLATPEPQALVHACTFLDVRPIYGQAALVERLRRVMVAEVSQRTVFQRQLAEVAVRLPLPLGAFGTFAYDKGTPHRGSIDLKQGGSRPFTDAARVLALSRRSTQTSTAERLRALADAGLFDARGLSGLVDSFHFIHLLRLRNQMAVRRRHVGPNRIFPRDLNELDRHVLREAFRQARKLQEVLAMVYQLKG